MKRIIAISIIALSALALTGCSFNDTITDYNTAAFAFEQKLPDGRTVICVNSQHGSISCDWENAK